MVNQSIVQQRGQVAFPAFMGERVYMREFRKESGLPSDLSRWQPTIDAMLDGVDTDGPIYLMIDQGVVQSGHTQRRPGMHIDGYWNPGISAHGGSTQHHGSTPPPSVGGHEGRRGGHSSNPDKFYDEHICPPGHRARTGRHASGGNGWDDADFSSPEGIILASNVSACRALSGTFSGSVGEGGDCSRLSLDGMNEIILKPYTVYAGNVCMLHESLPVYRDVQRTLVRLNVPGWTPVIQ